jgi:hypothetical protein
MASAQWRKTACNLCYVNCGIEVLVNDGRIERVRGDRLNPKSQGYLCNKATRIPYYAHHKDRHCGAAPMVALNLSHGTRRLPTSASACVTSPRAMAARRLLFTAAAARAITLVAHMPTHSCARSARAMSSMRCHRRKPAISGSTATCLAARPATPPKMCTTATFCSHRRQPLGCARLSQRP